MRYGLVLLPGLELTFNHPDPDQAAHALAVGLRSAVPLEDGIASAMTAARAARAAVVAAHPSGPGQLDERVTRRFWSDFDALAPLVDRWELVNRHAVYGWIAERRLPAVASGDFHRLEHLATWKTLIPCRKHPDAIVRYLRSSAPVLLAPLTSALVARRGLGASAFDQNEAMASYSVNEHAVAQARRLIDAHQYVLDSVVG